VSEPYTPSPVAPTFPLTLPLDGEVINHANLIDGMIKKGLDYTASVGAGAAETAATVAAITPLTRLHTGTPGALQTAWAPGGLANAFEYVNLVTGPHIWFPLDLIHTSTLTSVSIGLYGAIGHAAFPGGKPQNMPNLVVIKMSATGVGAAIGSLVIDASANVGDYEANHVLTSSGLSEVIDVTNFTYWAYFQGENGTNALAGTRVYQPRSVSTL
jgi:hypothetical protein